MHYTLCVNAATSTLIMLSLFVLESRIGTSVFGIHRNASIWENPNVSLLNKRRWYIFSQCHFGKDLWHWLLYLNNVNPFYLHFIAKVYQCHFWLTSENLKGTNATFYKYILVDNFNKVFNFFNKSFPSDFYCMTSFASCSFWLKRWQIFLEISDFHKFLMIFLFMNLFL